MNEGVININKPKDWTSHDVVAKLRRIYGIKRIGHTGTLDPMATGVLPVCVGNCTRMIEFYDGDMKSYHAQFKLGITTDTLDITGEIQEEKSYQHVTVQDIHNAVDNYKGWVEQIPPKYSALKINGRRAYDLARAGEEVVIKPRRIFIEDIYPTSIRLEEGLVEIDVVCSGGTYVRTICDDIGRALGCGATMTELVRTGVGVFRIEDSVNLSQLMEMEQEDAFRLLRPVDETLDNLGKLELREDRIKYFLNGNQSGRKCYKVDQRPLKGEAYRVYGNGLFLGIGIIDENEELKARKVLASAR